MLKGDPYIAMIMMLVLGENKGHWKCNDYTNGKSYCVFVYDEEEKP